MTDLAKVPTFSVLPRGKNESFFVSSFHTSFYTFNAHICKLKQYVALLFVFLKLTSIISYCGLRQLMVFIKCCGFEM